MDSYFYFFIRLLSAFFLCQDANKTRSNCATISCNLSKKYKLTHIKHRTERESIRRVDQDRSYQELPPVQILGDRHPNTIEMPSWLVHRLCDFKAT